jgi:GTPase
VHTPSYPPSSDGSFAGSFGVPKLAAERDKDGHIEYKLKLIDPTPERFERLVTQMMWRLKQGRNEAIYEIGLAGE